jgi:hypothetical protein
MIQLLSFMTIGSGATSKLIGTSPSSRKGKIPSPHSCMLTRTICKRSMNLCSIRLSPRLKGLEYLTCLVCIKTGTWSQSLSFVPPHGEVAMVMRLLSTSALKATNSNCMSRSSPLFSDWPTMTFIGLRKSLSEPQRTMS